MTQIKILSAGLQELEVRGETKIVLQGVIEVPSMHSLRYADYQRELFPQASRVNIFAAFNANEAHQIPPIILGTRSQRFHTEGETYFLQDEAWVIDGKQRVGSAIEYAGAHPHAKVRLNCIVHFSTNEAWERELFHALNAFQKAMSPNVLLHNKRDEYRPILMFYGLTQQSGFVLHDRVCWQQNKRRTHLLTALTCIKVMSNLHTHIAPGRSNSMKELLGALVGLEAKLGMQHMRDNIAQFFNLVDECWGIRTITHRQCAPHMGGSFLIVLARILSDHSNFWRVNGKQLFVEADVRRKIGQLKLLEDENLHRLCGAGSGGMELLYTHMVRFINQGKTSRRLVAWADTIENRKKTRVKVSADAIPAAG